MIELKCHCSHPMTVPDDQAGGMIQCPACGRLNDVPSISDLKHLDADGSFKLDELTLADDRTRLREATRAFTRDRLDDFGNEIDLRPSLEEVARAGIEEIPLATDEKDLVGPPRYDPLTGELIEPLKVRKDEHDEHTGPIPMATPVLGYAGADGRLSMPVALALFAPENMIVMAIVLFFYLVMGAASILFIPLAIVLKISSIWFGMVFIAPLIAAHYVCVVGDIAMEDRDELPRPLRGVSWSEDIIQPLTAFLISAGICYLPLIVWATKIDVPQPALDYGSVALLVVGSALFPAMILTLVTSGSLINIRPDRLLGVIKACGLRYWVLVALWCLVVLLTLIGVGGIGMIPIEAFRVAMRKVELPGWLAVPIVLTQLYLAHYCAWKLGLLYRARYQHFPWVWQHHNYQNRTRRPTVRKPVAPAGSGRRRGA